MVHTGGGAWLSLVGVMSWACPRLPPTPPLPLPSLHPLLSRTLFITAELLPQLSTFRNTALSWLFKPRNTRTVKEWLQGCSVLASLNLSVFFIPIIIQANGITWKI